MYKFFIFLWLVYIIYTMIRYIYIQPLIYRRKLKSFLSERNLRMQNRYARKPFHENKRPDSRLYGSNNYFGQFKKKFETITAIDEHDNSYTYHLVIFNAAIILTTVHINVYDDNLELVKKI